MKNIKTTVGVRTLGLIGISINSLEIPNLWSLKLKKGQIDTSLEISLLIVLQTSASIQKNHSNLTLKPTTRKWTAGVAHSLTMRKTTMKKNTGSELAKVCSITTPESQ